MSEVRVIPKSTGPKCKHFNGIGNDVCRAGVNYLAVAKDHEPIEYRYEGDPPSVKPSVQRRSLPCIVKSNLGGAVCDKCELPTAEELAERDRQIRESFERMAKARAAIVAHLGGSWKKGTPGSRGAIDCPCCGKPGGLHFTRSGYNGHVHARCETDGCADWME
jgi:hypothetical protein